MEAAFDTKSLSKTRNMEDRYHKDSSDGGVHIEDAKMLGFGETVGTCWPRSNPDT